MTETQFIAVLSAGSALLGAAIGGAASAVTTWLQQRAERQRQLLDIAVKLEVEQLRALVAMMQASEVQNVAVGDAMHGVLNNLRTLELLGAAPLTDEYLETLRKRHYGKESRRESVPARKAASNDGSPTSPGP